MTSIWLARGADPSLRGSRRRGRHGHHEADKDQGHAPRSDRGEPSPALVVMIAEARAEGRTRLLEMPPMCDLPDELIAG